jgi:peroxiredoxin (alkyl hydroperoxide reductase subunit C)
VITVSRDTKFVHLAWQRDEKLLEKVKHPMGSDPTGRICRLFGVLDEASGLSLRGTFLISPQGMIMNSEVNFYNLGRNVEEILRKIIANKHLAANPAEACPSQWKKVGDITLKPSAKMVGKVSEAVKK